MKNFYHYFINCRPYSWGDLILLGFLAKFSVTHQVYFSLSDLLPISGLIALWIFYNLILEIKHHYEYRGKIPIILPFGFWVAGIFNSIKQNYLTTLSVFALTFLICLYINKSKNKILGIASAAIRGLIQSVFYFYAASLFKAPLQETAIIMLLIFFLYCGRAIVGDIRDIKHNAEMNKKTIPVIFGINKSKLLVVLLLIASAIFEVSYFKSYLLILPLVVYALALIIMNNGYILHQAYIVTTTFFSASLIIFFTGGFSNIVFINIIYLGVFFNVIFYSTIARKSNPIFIQ